jgi:hypothetical protein
MGLAIKIFTKGPIFTEGPVFTKGPKLIIDLAFGAFDMMIIMDLTSRSTSLLGNCGHLPKYIKC